MGALGKALLIVVALALAAPAFQAPHRQNPAEIPQAQPSFAGSQWPTVSSIGPFPPAPASKANAKKTLYLHDDPPWQNINDDYDSLNTTAPTTVALSDFDNDGQPGLSILENWDNLGGGFGHVNHDRYQYWNLTPVLASDLRISYLNMTLWISTTSQDVTNELKVELTDNTLKTLATPNANVFASRLLTGINWPTPAGNFQKYSFDLTMFNGTQVIPKGNRTMLIIYRTDNNNNKDLQIAYNTTIYPSHLNLTTDTYVDVNWTQTWNLTAQTGDFSVGEDARIVANVTDPFGSYDISGATVNVTGPGGVTYVPTTPMGLNATDPADPSGWKHFNYTFEHIPAPGMYKAVVTGIESNGVTSNMTAFFNATGSANPLDHVELMPMFAYPANNPVAVAGTLAGYMAVGWNDAGQTEKNYTWEPEWDTTDGLGTVANKGGSASSGFTADYVAGASPGYDNITVANATAAPVSSCVLVTPLVLDHIELAPLDPFPGANVLAGGTLGYTAIGWDDAGGTIKNSTWIPLWDTSAGLGLPVNPGGDWTAGYTIDYSAGLATGYDNITVACGSVGNESCLRIVANPLHHIQLTPMFAFPLNNPIAVGGTTGTYTAVGWNDAAEAEKNLTWSPVWGTTNALGTASATGGSAITGFTASYTASLAPGYDNITVTDSTAAGVVSASCVKVADNPLLHHIHLTPKAAYPSAADVGAGLTLPGFIATGWDDAAETKKNLTWAPIWGTSHGLGTAGNLGGGAASGFTADYAALGILGMDNITVSCDSVSNRSSIRVVAGPPAAMAYVSGNNQMGKVGSTLPLPLVVRVTDQFGNPVQGAAVNWKFFGGPDGSTGQALLPGSNSTDAAGRSGTWLTLGSGVGIYGANASTDLGLAGEPVNFTATATSAARDIVIVSGDGQTAPAGTALPKQLVVEVRDIAGTHVGSGVKVWFNATTANLAGDASITPANPVQTDPDGRASVWLRLDTLPGTNYLTAEMTAGGTRRVTFTAIGTAPGVSPVLATVAETVVGGDMVTYILHADNTGDGAAVNVWINDTLPLGMEYVHDSSAPAASVSGRDVAWFFDEIAPGAMSWTMTCQAQATVVDGTVLSNRFSVEYGDEAGRRLPRVESNTVDVTVITEESDNIPPTIEGVPDLYVHYDWDYHIDLSPYVWDPDTEPGDLTIILSDLVSARVNLHNNLAIILNYSRSLLGSTQKLNVTVSDGGGSDWQLILVHVTDDFPPELLQPLPDIAQHEDTVSYPFNITEHFFDRDGDSLFYTYGEKHVNITFLWNFTVRVLPNLNWFGLERVTFRASDPTGALVERTVNVTVSPVNDLPAIGAIPDQAGKVGKAWMMDLFQYVSDVDNALSELSVTTDSGSATANGLNVTFRFARAVEGDIVTITVSDGAGQAYGQVNVTVAASGALDPVCLVTAPLAAVALAALVVMLVYRRRNRPAIENIFAIYKDGTLLAHEMRKELPNFDKDIFTSMLQAITDFVKDSFQDRKDWTLDNLEFGGRKIHIARSATGNLSLAVVYQGGDIGLKKLMDALIADIEGTHGELLADWDGNLTKMFGIQTIVSKVFDDN
ncbi:MAG: hypothetical protein V1934_05690 [Methanobacteriota archaeon]